MPIKLLFCLCIYFMMTVNALAKELIAYSRLTDGYWQIWVMDPDGKNNHQITFTPSDKRNPAWYRDEAKVAYRTNNSELWIYDFHTQVETRYLKPFGVISNPDFSKTTDEVIFVRFDPRLSDSTEIWKSDLEGNRSVILTKDRLPKFEPDLSPDDKSIVFVKSASDKKSYQIWQMDITGENPEQLTDGRAYDLFPHYSPDQRSLVLASNRADKNYDLYVLDLGTKNLTRLTNEPGLEGHPSFSPNGEKIIFVSNRTGNQQIWVINKDGSQPTQLTFEEEESIDPVWGDINDNGPPSEGVIEPAGTL